VPYVISWTSAILWLSSFAKSYPSGRFAILSVSFVLALTRSDVFNHWLCQDTNSGTIPVSLWFFHVTIHSYSLIPLLQKYSIILNISPFFWWHILISTFYAIRNNGTMKIFFFLLTICRSSCILGKLSATWAMLSGLKIHIPSSWGIYAKISLRWAKETEGGRHWSGITGLKGVLNVHNIMLNCFLK
jgi:hypothetical protein